MVNQYMATWKEIKKALFAMPGEETEATKKNGLKIVFFGLVIAVVYILFLFIWVTGPHSLGLSLHVLGPIVGFIVVIFVFFEHAFGVRKRSLRIVQIVVAIIAFSPYVYFHLTNLESRTIGDWSLFLGVFTSLAYFLKGRLSLEEAKHKETPWNERAQSQIAEKTQTRPTSKSRIPWDKPFGFKYFLLLLAVGFALFFLMLFL